MEGCSAEGRPYSSPSQVWLSVRVSNKATSDELVARNDKLAIVGLDLAGRTFPSLRFTGVANQPNVSDVMLLSPIQMPLVRLHPVHDDATVLHGVARD
jgi:hypothetical protein